MAADAEKLRAQAERIKELRKAKERRDGQSISQETAAHGVGISVRTYRTWEGIGADIKLKNLKALASYYETSTDYIERGATEPLSTPDLSNGASQLDRIELAVSGLAEQVRVLQASIAKNAAEVLARIDDIDPPKDQSQHRRPA